MMSGRRVWILSRDGRGCGAGRRWDAGGRTVAVVARWGRVGRAGRIAAGIVAAGVAVVALGSGPVPHGSALVHLDMSMNVGRGGEEMAER